ncbi:DUF6349 family protein [Aeromicrobium sp. CF4.19]|uniref:DUF6349 family protein n=1 Tax=Aeromicrobium sp. CF4.19 TaxID=3373082 RepID=UPI003EE47753
MDQPALFDLDQMAREAVAATPWTGAPLTFTTDYYPPAQLLAAYERWVAENGRLGASPQSHMWHVWEPQAAVTETHALQMLTADLRCWPGDHRRTGQCHCPGTLMYQANCEPCRWQHITDDEQEAVEAWHDHAMPGWRDLPAMPLKLTKRDERGRLTKKATAWLDEHQPTGWRFTGAPIRTEREPMGSRHVAGRPPFGGYDLGHIK